MSSGKKIDSDSFCFVDSKEISVPAQNQIHVNSNFNPTIFCYVQGCALRKNSTEPNVLNLRNRGCPIYDFCAKRKIS